METELKPVPSDPGSRWAMPTASIEQVAVAPNQVLRNTYWLLALSMIPTVAGAYVGMAINFAAFFRTSPIMAPLLLFAAMIGSLFVVAALRNSGWGIVAVFGFTFIAGLSLTPTLYYAAGLKNGGQLVALAAAMTAGVPHPTRWTTPTTWRCADRLTTCPSRNPSGSVGVHVLPPSKVALTAQPSL